MLSPSNHWGRQRIQLRKNKLNFACGLLGVARYLATSYDEHANFRLWDKKVPADITSRVVHYREISGKARVKV